MLKGFLGKIVGDPNEREVRKLQPLVDSINKLEGETERRVDALQSRVRSQVEPIAAPLTRDLRARLASGENLDDLLPEAFAAVREIAKRTVDMRPFDVQLIGGIVLHQGKVAEMRTGEGKTLVATMPVYLNGLLAKGVHLVTVNDYLARRDSLWMGPIYHHLGLTVGLLQSGRDQPAYLYDPSYQREPYPGLRPVPRKEAYLADVTYGTNNEFGFDYLRDNLALSLAGRVQRPLYYAIVDEVDNIFIDEARTPLIISGPSGEPVEEYGRFATIARKLEPELHYELDEKERAVFLTDEGLAVVEQETGIENLYDEANYRYVHYMQQALKAQVLFQQGRDYIIRREGGKRRIMLVDQHTGRLMPDRRLSEGLHQAIEAKEGVDVLPRDVTSATVTIQNYFRMYQKLAGMSGTAVTEGEEFFKIYKLDVLAIPTHKPNARVDHPDVVFHSEETKLRAVVREILSCHTRGQPVLVGTTSVEMSERLSKRLSGERLQMACLAPRAAYALRDQDLEREDRARLRGTLDESLETISLASWSRLLKAVDLEHSALSRENMDWLAGYLELPDDPAVRQALEKALRDGIPHKVLNAKEHTGEAAVIARAGEPGAVTIATNMAGRGVDIKLGGELGGDDIHRAHLALRALGLNPFRATPAQMDSAIAQVTPQYARRREQVLKAGGLHVLGTERHEARRIDNQLRGRSGRQGEPGSSRFFLSLEDDLMRRFGRREMLSKLMVQMGDDVPIEHGLVSRTIERAQTSVEGYNFDIRKHLLEYDDVLNKQRETIYAERLRILKSDDLRPEVWRMLERQVDEWMGTQDEAARQRLLYAGLDDILPLQLPAPSAPFQGPVAFTGHLTAFPPFSISHLAGELAGQALEDVRQSLQQIVRQAAEDYGEQVLQTVREVAHSTLEKYEDRLARYQALLDEKADEYLQLIDERGQDLDLRRLAQHMERTFPLKLTAPRSSDPAALDEVRSLWAQEVEIGFHQQTCTGFLDRIQLRLPGDIRLDRLRPARLTPDRLKEDLERALSLAVADPIDEAARRDLAAMRPPADPSPTELQELIATLRRSSKIDLGRLDRLVGHVLGVQLDDLLGRYQLATDADQARLRRDLERLRESLDESKRAARVDLPALFRQLNTLVHLEIDDLESALSECLSHEYAKWAQRQLVEIESAGRSSPLADTGWAAIAEHLLSTLYVQKQVYDREHQRRLAWTPRFPLALLVRAQVAGREREELRETLLTSLRTAVELRERHWGEQELQRWSRLSLADLPAETFDHLVRYLGDRALGESKKQPVDDLPPEIGRQLSFILAVRKLGEQRLADLADGDHVLAELITSWEAQTLDTPVSALAQDVKDAVARQLRQSGALDDSIARAAWADLPVRDWDRRVREEVAGFLGRRYVEANKDRRLIDLDRETQAKCLTLLQRQQAFVDEARVQQFLVHQSLSDLPLETATAALHLLARARLERLARRKISNIDVTTRQIIVSSLQRLGLFTDHARREQWLSSSASLDSLGADLVSQFGRFLAHHRLGADAEPMPALGQTEPGVSALQSEPRPSGLRLCDLGTEVASQIVQRLRHNDILADRKRLEALPQLRVGEVDDSVAAAVHQELLETLRADLAAKTFGELPADIARQVHDALAEHNHFVDEEKVDWYERKTLAQLPSELLRGLEEHAGQLQLADLAPLPFRDLPPHLQQQLLAILDGEAVALERAERLRLTQVGSLAELGPSERAAVARQLGRNWLVSIRDRRPGTLADSDRELAWSYLRSAGYFSDSFKEELFPFQKLSEFSPEIQQAVWTKLAGGLTTRLETQPIGRLPQPTQSLALAAIRASGCLVDEARQRQIEELPMSQLAPDLREAVEGEVGAYLLQGVQARPLAEWPEAIRQQLWRYLDEIGYFIDEKKRNQILDRRPADLGAEQYEALVADLAVHLEGQLLGIPVSELSDDLRQGLREAVGALGYFENQGQRAQAMEQPLGSLRREDLDSLATLVGQAQMAAWGDRRLGELPAEEQQAILSHVQSRDLFLDRGQLDRFQTQPLRALPGLGERFLEDLRQQQRDRLAQTRLESLDPVRRRIAYRALQDRGLALDEREMRPLRLQEVVELEQPVYDELLRHLGSQSVAGWGTTRFKDLDAEGRELLADYLGRRVMSRIEQRVLLYTISRLWVDYLTDIEDLRRGIGLEAFGQRDPLVQYKGKALELFEALGDNIRRDVVRTLFRQAPQPLSEQ